MKRETENRYGADGGVEKTSHHGGDSQSGGGRKSHLGAEGKGAPGKGRSNEIFAAPQPLGVP